MKDRYLFRGKQPTSGEWAEGALVHDASGIWYIISEMLSEITCCEACGMPDMKYSIVDPTTVGQYTGLKDKNNELIFEGDIVTGNINFMGTDNAVMGTVEYDCLEGLYHVENEPLQRFVWDTTTKNPKTTIEIVGNIHDKEGEGEV